VDPSRAPWRAFDTPSAANSPAEPPAARIPRGPTLAIAAAIAGLVAGAAVLAMSNSNGGDVIVGRPPAEALIATADPAGIVVDVGGAVTRPGVYSLPAGSRLADAIAAAGGFGPRVDAARTDAEINLAAPLADGQQVVVPSRDDPLAAGAPGGPSGATSVAPTDLVDLNRATAAELEALPGIGPVTAAKIIAARKASPFAAVQDLRDRKLVGQKAFDALRDLVTVR